MWRANGPSRVSHCSSNCARTVGVQPIYPVLVTSTFEAQPKSEAALSNELPLAGRFRLVPRIVFPMIVLFGALVVISHPVRYASSGTVAIIGSETAAQRETRIGKPVDPRYESVLARFRDPTVVSDIFVRVYSSWTKQEALRKRGLVGELGVSGRTSVASLTPDHGPIVVFTVVSGSGEEARLGVKLVVDDFERELRVWQAGAFPSLSVSVAVITAPSGGVPLGGSRPRAAVAVVVFGALAAWLLGRLLELRKVAAPNRRTAADRFSRAIMAARRRGEAQDDE